MKKKYILIFLILSCFCVYTNIYSQTSLQKKEYLKIYDAYTNSQNNGLINGRSYLQQILTVNKHHPFYISPDFIQASIIYNNQKYTSLLKYDIVNDMVVIKNKGNSKLYALSVTPTFVNAFTVHKTNFVRLLKHKDLEDFYGNGFFEKVFVGKNIRFFIKKKKKTIEVLDYEVPRYKFKRKDLFILYKNNRYYKISKQKHLKKALPNFKKEIATFFRYSKDINAKSLKKLFTQLDKKIHTDEIK